MSDYYLSYFGKINNTHRIPFDFKEFNFKVTEWLDTEEGKSELLKFIDEMKLMSNKKSTQMNPLLSKSINFTDAVEKNDSTRYDDLGLFEEILTTDYNKMPTNEGSNTIQEPINNTAKIITRNSLQTQSQSWNSEPEGSGRIQEKPVYIDDSHESLESEVKKSFDPQNLIERIRKTYDASHATPNFEILTCKSQTFLQRMAVLGEILT